MKRILLVLFAILSVSACKQQIKFNKNAWKEKGDLGIYQNREKMIDDLMQNHRLKGLTYQQVTDLLGQPEKRSNLKAGELIRYNILTDYGQDIDPVRVRDLEIRLNIYSIVDTAKLIKFSHN